MTDKRAYQQRRRREASEAKQLAKSKGVDPNTFLTNRMLLMTVGLWIRVSGEAYARKELSKTGLNQEAVEEVNSRTEEEDLRQANSEYTRNLKSSNATDSSSCHFIVQPLLLLTGEIRVMNVAMKSVPTGSMHKSHVAVYEIYEGEIALDETTKDLAEQARAFLESQGHKVNSINVFGATHGGVARRCTWLHEVWPRNSGWQCIPETLPVDGGT
jgi:hypothetical protein